MGTTKIALIISTALLLSTPTPSASQVKLDAFRPPAAACALPGPRGLIGSVVQPGAPVQHRINKTASALDFPFIENRGQHDGSVRYYRPARNHAVYFTDQEVVMAFAASARTNNESHHVTLGLRFLGADGPSGVHGLTRQATQVNYYMGNDQRSWRTGLAAYRDVRYRDVWSQIDAVFRGGPGVLKYEFVLEPGANLDDIRLTYRGAERLSLDSEGNLRVQTSAGLVTDTRPVSYQELDGEKRQIETRFVLTRGPAGEHAFGFAFAAGYDPRHPVVIDPGLDYSTFLGGTSFDTANAIAVDHAGNAYIVGDTSSPDFPTTADALDSTLTAAPDLVIAKFDHTGSTLLYATFFGGNSSDGTLPTITIDDAGNAYVAGWTFSSNLPTTVGAVDPSYNGRRDTFILKLNPGGALAYATYLGGRRNDDPSDIVVDALGNVHLAGNTGSPDFPTTATAFQPSLGLFNDDAFVTKLDATGSALLYSSRLGGNIFDTAGGIALGPTGIVYLVGLAASADFPVTPDALSRVRNGPNDAFLAKFDTSAAGAMSLLYSTYLGGRGSDGGPFIKVAVDPGGDIYVAGTTNSPDFPTTENAFDRIGEGDVGFSGFGFATSDIFVSKLDGTGTTLLYSTYLSGCANEALRDMAIDPAGNVYVTGSTASATFPTTAGAFDESYNGSFTDAFVAKVNPAATGESSLMYSTFLGGRSTDTANGLVVDPSGHVYVTGTTSSPDFPTTPDAFDREHNPPNAFGFAATDAFVAKLDPTPQVRTDNLVERILALIEEALNRGLGHEVTPTLEAAARQLAGGNTAGATGLLRAFTGHVDALVSAGSASSEQAQPLIEVATRMISQLAR